MSTARVAPGLARGGRGRGDEHGAVALMVAMSMVLLCVVAAFVLDFGLIRVDRQTNKSASDAAAAAGLRGLDQGDGVPHPWAGVCRAVQFLKVNDAKFSDLTGTWSTGAGAGVADGCDPVLASAPCLRAPGNEASWAAFEGTALSGSVKVRIQSGYDLDTPQPGGSSAWPDESYSTHAGDDGDPSMHGCDHLVAMIWQTRDPGLGKLVTDAQLTTSVRSVGRLVQGEQGEQGVALVTLERHDCPSLSTDGTTTKIRVDGFLDMPGMIHADSLGDGTGCGGARVMEVNGNNPHAIVAGAAETDPTVAGIITVHALNGGPGAMPANAAEPYPYVHTEPDPPGAAPTGGELVSREPVDTDYFTGVKSAMATANAVFANAATIADRVISGPECAEGGFPAANGTPGTWYFDCPSGVSYSSNVSLPNATRVIFGSSLEVRSGREFAMPQAAEVYVGGSAGTGLLVKGAFRMHTRGQSTCAAADPLAAQRGRLVIRTGSLKSEAGAPMFQACSTSVIMMGGQADGCVSSVKGIEPQDATFCTNASVALAGAASTDWTAPDRVTEGRTQADLDDLEDLALWTESEALSSITGSGGITLAGVFVLPNANPFDIGGNGVQDMEDCQYFTRKLRARGGGTLVMKPNPYNITTIPYLGGFGLVR